MRTFPFASSVVFVGALALTAPAAVAQDFIGAFARRAAQAAAQGVASRAVQGATRPADNAPAQQPAAAARATAASADGLGADFPAPRPLNFSTGLRRPTQMQFSAADMNAKKAFDEIGRYACPSCEGGYNFDSWVQHEVPSLWGQYVLENRLGSMAVGEAIRWTGSHTRTVYAITVVDDRSIGQWACKQLKWTGDRGTTHIERPGLICKPTANWHTVL